MGTMSKALAGFGGYAAVSSLLRDYFINTSRSLIYSTALPHVTLAHDIAAIRYVRSHPEEGEHLQELSRMFRTMCQSKNFSYGTSTTQIIPIITNDERKALSLKAHLAENNIIAPAIRPPTVPPGSARVRLSLHNALGNDEIEHIIKVLTSWDGV
jgi:8-amino-7-oxononanoate synthase